MHLQLVIAGLGYIVFKLNSNWVEVISLTTLLYHIFILSLKIKQVCAESLQLCLTLCNPIDCSPPVYSVHGILQARILEWVAIPFSMGTSQPRDETLVSCIAGRLFTIWATRDAHFNLKTEEKIIKFEGKSKKQLSLEQITALASTCAEQSSYPEKQLFWLKFWLIFKVENLK